MILAHALPEGLQTFPLLWVLIGLAGSHVGLAALLDRRGRADGGHGAVEGDREVRQPVGGGRVGLGGFVVVVLLAAFGSPVAARNYADVVVLGLLWGTVVLCSVVAGDVWSRIDPLAALDRLRRGPAGGPPVVRPGRTAEAGVVVSMLAWAWAQLLWQPGREAFLVALLGYAAAHLTVAARVGSGWLARGEALRRTSATLGLLTVRQGGPVGRLVGVPSPEGHVTVAALLIGWALTDLVVESAVWADLRLTTAAPGLVGLGVLVGACALVAVLLRTVLGPRLGAAAVPLAAGWAVAQYVPRVWVQAQGALVWLADPLDVGLGLPVTDGLVDAAAVPVAVTVLQVVAFLAGHVLAAHTLRRLAAAHLGARPAAVATVTAGPQLLVLLSLVGGAHLQLAGL